VASSLFVDDGQYDNIDRARRRKWDFLEEKENKTKISATAGTLLFLCMHVMVVGGWVDLI
jgi:hypothetical protein